MTDLITRLEKEGGSRELDAALLAMSEVDKSSRGEAEARECLRAAIPAFLRALSEQVAIVPRQLDSSNAHHWRVAEAGIKCIEEHGGEMGSDWTPERQISDVYQDMIRALEDGK